MTIFCFYSKRRIMKMFGYTCNEIIFVHCPDDFASPPVRLHASVSTRVWNSLWRAAVQWNYYFNRLLKFYGRLSSAPRKANCFTCLGNIFFQRKNEYSQIWHWWIPLFFTLISGLLHIVKYFYNIFVLISAKISRTSMAQ